MLRKDTRYLICSAAAEQMRDRHFFALNEPGRMNERQYDAIQETLCFMATAPARELSDRASRTWKGRRNLSGEYEGCRVLVEYRSGERADKDTIRMCWTFPERLRE